jgi:hypothetical protein
MAILELSILNDNIILLEKQFYQADNILDKNIRNGLLQAISNLVDEAFGEQVQSFSLGEYSIVLVSSDIGVAVSEDEDDEETIPKKKLLMYCIVNRNTDEKIIIKSMNEALFQFTNRYSINDIFQKKVKKFKKFEKRLDKIFGDLILKSEDRFKSLF